MKSTIQKIAFIVAISAAISAVGQSGARRPQSFSAAIDAEITNLENSLVPLVEAMPEDKFDFTPESLNIPNSELKSVRTFAAQVRHVAADNFAYWAALAFKPEPAGLNAPAGPPELKSKAELVDFLKKSFVFAHEAASGITAQNATGEMDFRGSKVSRISLVVSAFSHANDHYGQMVEYLRMVGVVPPGSRPKQR